MECSADTRVILLLKNIPKLGCSNINRLLNQIKKPQNILDYNKNDLILLGLDDFQINKILNPNWSYVDKQITFAKNLNIEIISLFDQDYPERLKHIYDPPSVLYTMGNKKLLSSQQFAIVGTRKPTIYGKQMAEYFTNELLTYGYTITSGFALGIDIIAHLTTVNKNFPTVVVLGTSLDKVYPVTHKKYISRILDTGGVIVSENGFTTGPHPSVFPRRNRIISGLSRGVLVVEAARKSGSLISARCAMEQSREVFAIPGNISNPQALGCLDLISQGAKLVVDIEDIIEELDGIKLEYKNIRRTSINSSSYSGDCDLYSASRETLVKLDSVSKSQKVDRIGKSCQDSLDQNQQQLLNALSGGVVEFDTIVNDSNMSSEQVASQLVQLEIMGLVANVPGGYIKVSI